MKILHIVFSFKYGGIETMLVNIVNEQIQDEDVSILIINNSYNQNLIDKIDKRVRIIKVNRPIKSKNPYYIIKMNYLIHRLAPNIIHTHTTHIIHYLLPYFHAKTVNTFHETPNPIDLNYLHLYKQIFAISKSVQTDLKRHGFKSIIIENGIRPQLFIPKTSGYNSNEIFKIVQIGRLEHYKKGHDLLLEACALLINKGIVNFHVDFIGEGESMEYLKKITYNKNLNEYITFLGSRDTYYIEKHLKDYHLLVQPSRIEGFGLTVAEAMASNVPVLVSGQEGPMEIINHGEFGYFFKNENVEDLAEKIKKIMNENISIINGITQRAKLRIEKCYNVKNTAIKYLKEYNQI